MPITPEFALAFAREWIEGANARDFDRVLARYAEDVVVTSPYIRVVTGDSSGRLVGRNKLRDYWTASLAKRAELRFELLDAFVGADSVVIHYVNRGIRCAEVFYFDERERIVRSDAHYLEAEAAPS
jgi:ketosteroid isomerase-like protein